MAFDKFQAWRVANVPVDSPFSSEDENLSREKRRRISLQKLTDRTVTGKEVDTGVPSAATDEHNKKRKTNRLRANGVVALTSFEKPVVGNIYDIAPGGVSFLHVNETDVDTSELTMDIVIFDSLTDFEYFIGQVSGRVVWKELVAEPENNAPMWRFNVEFLELDSSQQSRLQTLCNVDETANVWFLDERLPKISYES